MNMKFAAVAEQNQEKSSLKPKYLEAVSRVERLHRRLLDLIKDEFDRMGWDDINSTQALMMFNMEIRSLQQVNCAQEDII